MLAAYVLGALVLALVVAIIATLAIVTFSVEAVVYERHDYVRALHAEREALRTLRARYACGQVTIEEYRRLTHELVAGHAA